jgi:hypothetical protein
LFFFGQSKSVFIDLLKIFKYGSEVLVVLDEVIFCVFYKINAICLPIFLAGVALSPRCLNQFFYLVRIIKKAFSSIN